MAIDVDSRTLTTERTWSEVVADFLRGQGFTAMVAIATIGLSLVILGLMVGGTWLETPPTDLEHEEHVRVLEVTERVGRRAGFRDNDILISIAGQDALGKTDAELAAILDAALVEAHQATLDDLERNAPSLPNTDDPVVLMNAIRLNANIRANRFGDARFIVLATVQRAGDITELEISNRLPETSPSETDYVGWDDYGMVIETRPSQNLPNPDGASVSLFEVIFGSSDILPSLDIDSLVADDGGLDAVRGLDRFLMLYPLGILGVIVLMAGWAYLRWGGKTYDNKRGLFVEPRQIGRYTVTPDRLLTWATLLSIVLVVIAPTWEFASNGQWRSDLIDDYGGDLSTGEPATRDVNELPDVFVDTFHAREIVIDADANRDNAAGQLSIARQTLLEMQRSNNTGQIWDLTIALAVLVFATRVLVYAEADGLVTNPDRMMAVLVLAPSLILLGIFVYGFIAQNIQYSMTDWGEQSKGAPSPFESDVTRVNIGLENYQDLMTDFTESSFRTSLVNTFFFTILFLGAALGMGFLLAFLVDQRVFGEGIFRTIFLFPMSLSLVVTGTVWNWMLQQGGGINQLPVVINEGSILGVQISDITGVQVFGQYIFPAFVRGEALEYQWIASRNTIYQFTWDEASAFVYLGLALMGVVTFNFFAKASERAMTYTVLFAVGAWLFYVSGWWGDIWLPLDVPLSEPIKGYNVALTGAILAATWQMAGYVMALFLAGIRGVSEELREAARVDGCAEWQVYLFIIFPTLRPIVLSAIIILGHISLKVFDLIFALSGPDFPPMTVPGILLYTTAFRANRLASGSAIAVIILVLVSLVIIPYLYSSNRESQQEGR